MDQGSDFHKTDDSTSFQIPETPRLCATGCGFYGKPETRNLCSKCYRDFLKQEREMKETEALLFKNLPSATNSVIPGLKCPETNPFRCFRPLSETSETSTSATAGEDKIVNSTQKRNRCHSCNKKTGLLGFTCRCGASFCSVHRYPESHSCTFDFKSAGRVALAKENPLCKADKLRDRL